MGSVRLRVASGQAAAVPGVHASEGTAKPSRNAEGEWNESSKSMISGSCQRQRLERCPTFCPTVDHSLPAMGGLSWATAPSTAKSDLDARRDADPIRRPGAGRSLDSDRLDFLGVEVLPGFIDTLRTLGAGITPSTGQRVSPEEGY